MNTKTIIAGILAGIVSFLLGWLIYGMLLMEFFKNHSLHYNGLDKNPPDFLYLGIGNLLMGILTAYVVALGNGNNAKKGFTIAAIVGFLVSSGMDSMMFAQMNLGSRTAILVDVIAATILSGIIGAFVGWWYGRKSAA